MGNISAVIAKNCMEVIQVREWVLFLSYLERMKTQTKTQTNKSPNTGGM